MCNLHYEQWTGCVRKELIKKGFCELSKSTPPCPCTNDISLLAKDGLCPDCATELKKGVKNPKTKRCVRP